MPQAANLLGLLPDISPAVSDGCSSVGTNVDRIAASPAVEAIIDKTAMAVGISLPLLRSVISVESSFNPGAVSKKKAVGLMQLMPETAARFGVQNRFDPDENVRAGARYLRWLVANFHGDVSLALAAYNAGEQAVRNHSGIPPFPETEAYVAAVKQRCAC
jgi:soluble lytic murein transglycosylase-like protein